MLNKRCLQFRVVPTKCNRKGTEPTAQIKQGPRVFQWQLIEHLRRDLLSIEVQSAKQSPRLVTIREKWSVDFRSFSAPKSGGELAPSLPRIKLREQKTHAVAGKMSGRKSSIGVFFSALVQQAHCAESVAEDFPIGWISAEVCCERNRVLLLLSEPSE
jgi:hypothetical protein